MKATGKGLDALANHEEPDGDEGAGGEPDGDEAMGLDEKAQLSRKLRFDVGYMEVSAPAGAVGCGGCRFVSDGMCTHPEVRAQVDAEHGWCKKFWPREGLTFPSQEVLVAQGRDPEMLDGPYPPARLY